MEDGKRDKEKMRERVNTGRTRDRTVEESGQEWKTRGQERLEQLTGRKR